MYLQDVIYEIRTRREMEGGNDENEPKWRQTRCLGHRCVFFKNSFICYDTKVMFYVVIVGCNLQNADG